MCYDAGCDHDKRGHSRLLQNRDGHVGEISKLADVTQLDGDVNIAGFLYYRT